MNNTLAPQLNTPIRIKASTVAYWLLSRGISSIKTEELACLLGIPNNQVPQRMAPLKRRGEIVSPAEGLWMPVPPEYGSWGAPSAIEMIDAIMRHMNVSYYVGWLSAAELHGASHHAPQVFQVATSKAVRDRSMGRSHFRFYHRSRIKLVPTSQKQTRSGMALVSCKEATLLDIACDIGMVGGVDNAANLVIELCETDDLDIDKIVTISGYYPDAALRRLGFLVETYTNTIGTDKLKAACSMRKTATSLLDPTAGNGGATNTDWNLRINREVEPDV